MRHALTETIRKVRPHSWSIFHPYRDSEWFTSDRPVRRLRYATPDGFDRSDGWNRACCELLLPLSPRHLLYAQVGKRRPGAS
jgi:hypothetical protein